MIKTLAERIKDAMDNAGVSNADVARHVGCRSQAITQWLNGETKSLQGKNLIKFCELTQYNPDYIANGRLPKKTVQTARIAEPITHYKNPKHEKIIQLCQALNNHGLNYITEQLNMISKIDKYTTDPPSSKIVGGSRTG